MTIEKIFSAACTTAVFIGAVVFAVFLTITAFGLDSVAGVIAASLGAFVYTILVSTGTFLLLDTQRYKRELIEYKEIVKEQRETIDTFDSELQEFYEITSELIILNTDIEVTNPEISSEISKRIISRI